MNLLLKSFLYLIFFSMLHFGYDLSRWAWLKPFCGIDESIFQHLKMAFWAYILASLVEYPFFKDGQSFWYPRLLAAVLVPWVIFVVYFLGPATIGRFGSSSLEVTWAIVVSYFSGLSGGLIERQLQQQKLAFSFKALIIFLFLASAFLYIAFTYKRPWLDMFKTPD